MNRTVYKSDSYLVLANEAGTEITNLHSGYSEFLQGDDSNLLRGAIEVVPARVPEEKVISATDQMLSEYFGADR